MSDVPNPYALHVLHSHLSALESLDTDECSFSYTMPDEATDRAYTVALWYFIQTQGDYYVDMYANV